MEAKVLTMKRVEVAQVLIGTMHGMHESRYTRIKNIVEEWVTCDNEEGAFIRQHTKKPVEIVSHDNPESFTTVLIVYAFFDEEIETFWRLKFK